MNHTTAPPPTHFRAVRDLLTGEPVLERISVRHADEPGVITAQEAATVTPEQVADLAQIWADHCARQARAASRRRRAKFRDSRRIWSDGQMVGYAQPGDLMHMGPVKSRPAISIESLDKDAAYVWIGTRLLGAVQFELGDGTGKHTWRIIPLSCIERAHHWGLPSRGTRQRAIDALINGDYTL